MRAPALARRRKGDDSRSRSVERARGTGAGKKLKMQRQNERDLRDQLVKLRAEHRDLDDEIVRLEGGSTADQLVIKRLKKRKLALKDQITAVEDQLLPDIIA